MKLFANNYSMQEVKIKGCKSVLNRVHCLLTHLSYSELDACPFLGTKDGIHVADLAFIPEQYRLDVKRAEELLNRSLKRWLAGIKSKP